MTANPIPNADLIGPLVETEETLEEPEGFSRDPADYSPTNHFLTRFSDAHGSPSDTRVNPSITGDVIETCIREGELSPAHGGRWRLETEVDDHLWRLVVAIEPNPQTNWVCSALVPGRRQPTDHDPDARLGGGRR